MDSITGLLACPGHRSTAGFRPNTFVGSVRSFTSIRGTGADTSNGFFGLVQRPRIWGLAHAKPLRAPKLIACSVAQRLVTGFGLEAHSENSLCTENFPLTRNWGPSCYAC